MMLQSNVLYISNFKYKSNTKTKDTILIVVT